MPLRQIDCNRRGLASRLRLPGATGAHRRIWYTPLKVRQMEFSASPGFYFPFTMADWAVIVASLRTHIAHLLRISEAPDFSEDDVTDAYTDLEAAEGIPRQVLSEVEKRYRGLSG